MILVARSTRLLSRESAMPEFNRLLAELIHELGGVVPEPLTS